MANGEVIKKWGKRVVHMLQLLFENLQDHELGQRTRYAYYYKYTHISKKTVLYESFFGMGMLCNPYAIFLELINNSEYSGYKHIWVLDNIENHVGLIREYRKHKNVRFIQYQSREYLKYLCKAKYLINNVTFPTYYTKKKGQIYVNTWYGIPLKALGYDMPNGKTAIANTVRNMISSDYLISANSFLTQIYLKSYKMEQLYQGKIIEEGYPRLDILNRFSREQIIDKLKRYGVNVGENKKIILYAPTWKGKSYGRTYASVYDYYAFKEELDKYIDTSAYQILVKVHQRVFQLAKDKLVGGWLVPETIDADEILSITDILISDVSSIFYDFLATRRPVLFYIKDADSYKKQIGMYMELGKLPGPYTDNIYQLADWINDIDSIYAEYKGRIDKQAAWADVLYQGNISKKIVDIIFAGHEKGYAVHREKADKKKMLISRGGMLVNGISTSLLNLLNNIDYDDWDITLMITKAKNQKENEMIEQINPSVRVMLGNDNFNMTFIEQMRHKYYMKYGIKNPQKKIYQREVRRSYGETVFDYAIDFEGYNLFHELLILQNTKSWRGIWLHNDMLSEKEVRFRWLTSVFDLYRHFDATISCSQDIMKVNRERLSCYCEKDKFHYAKNMIDARRIEEGVSADSICGYDGEKYIRVNENLIYGSRKVEMIPLLHEEKKSGKPSYVFVNMARLSVEKNQSNLILAVARLVREGENVFLYILGDGPLKEQLVALISDLKLAGHIILAGNVKNPFAIMRYCDCFVLPSLHEGQPMVIHEARAMHMPIIVSDFDSVSGVMIENGQYLIGKEIEDIYEGLRAYIEGKVPTDYSFDVNAYNKEAYQEFLDALEVYGV